MSEEFKAVREFAKTQLDYFIGCVEKTIIKINKLKEVLEKEKNSRMEWRKVLERLK